MRVEELEELFHDIDEQLDQETTLFTIGGAPMLFREQKPATKDIDLIASSETDQESAINALKELGFRLPSIGIDYEDLRGRKVEVDLGGFRGIPVSSRMKERVESAPIGGLDKLRLMLISNEDNIIFKSMGEREKDYDDIHSIISNPIDWGVVLEESEKLTRETLTSGETPTLFPGFIAVSLREVMEKHGGVSEDIIKKFEQSAIRLNEVLRRETKD